jgi:hypothetical protein
LEIKTEKGLLKINLAFNTLNDLNSYLKNTRWPDEIVNSGWDYGTNLSFFRNWSVTGKADLTGESRKSI